MEGDTSFLSPIRTVDLELPPEALMAQDSETECFIGDQSMGYGRLMITHTNSLLWIASNNNGITIDLDKVSVHGLCQDAANFPHKPALFLMTDGFYRGSLDDMADQQDAESATPCTQIWFAPRDEAQLAMFDSALRESARSHEQTDDSFFNFMGAHLENGDDDIEADDDGDFGPQINAAANGQNGTADNDEQGEDSA